MAVELRNSVFAEADQHFSPPSAYKDLYAILTGDEDVLQTSTGENFGRMRHGRDTREILKHLLPLMPDIVADGIVMLAKLQGTQPDFKSEEEPGRTIHEKRPVPTSDQETNRNYFSYQDAASKWGEREDGVYYYGSVDATPNNANLIAEYVLRYGPEILDIGFDNKDGNPTTIRESVYANLKWLEGRVGNSRVGFLEYKRNHSECIENQILRDSLTSVIHPNGELANHLGPIATIELQAFAYDAFRNSRILFPEAKYQQDVTYWQKLARQIRDNVFENLWMPDQNYFAMGMDRNENGDPRLIKTISSLPIYLLGSQIFDQLHPDFKRFYIEAIGKRVFSSEFLTDIGIRCLSTVHQGLTGFQDYHGVDSVWKVENIAFADAFRSKKLIGSADELNIRHLNGVNTSGDDEFGYVGADNNICYSPRALDQFPHDFQNDDYLIIVGTNIPEIVQGWTASGTYRVKNRHKVWESEFLTPDPGSSEYESESEWLKKIDRARIIRSKVELKVRRQQAFAYLVDTAQGIQLDQKFRLKEQARLEDVRPDPVRDRYGYIPVLKSA
ncbi:MAG: hypothetical protein ACD_30C00007G0004 [uncultured bacterium]|uniref:Amylo-alpha-16-glucosidase n=3 Tax=Candidatus Daviesiibacteriota TaxID=1752718 RepID=A0A0G0ER51_9BACT|nr:MAG: hypothetical protein ACD_30C00007G0004 [uncultured bacterium]KKQ08017.1 MAG: Amylo-alpha-16-glucosidase [Candidatus Daviesbacteria bacterium GW2011_GWB1_36_5]KKQ13809.1 MAG: Amylo-alpha-16-glucosidase [Candidatus Daviesbacteria bacterium GW2011_GWA1_36_8]OGE33463.1 MAG: hypothetical protein A3C99_00175 [Candidatus Daviesbacteria bacterium RIFCSPHIGHO2_02_FULL_37_9]OGE35071.1 MAG: hypothetical protein A3E66_04615 [Candidatus Daviesbacteria bacterium RIFCSPHIGHO2_12_FULL_37_16]